MRSELVIASPRPHQPGYPSKPGLAERGGDFIQDDHSHERDSVDESKLRNNCGPEGFETAEEYSSREHHHFVDRETEEKGDTEPERRRPGRPVFHYHGGNNYGCEGRTANRHAPQARVRCARKMEESNPDTLIRQPDDTHDAQ